MRNRILLVAALATLTASATAQARTWTIARDVYTAEGELVAVRGKLAYLRFGERVEAVPLERLGPEDHQYIETLELAPVGSGENASVRSAAQTSELPPQSGPLFPSSNSDPLAPPIEHSLIVPAASTAETGQADRSVSPATMEEMLPLPPGATAPPQAAAPIGRTNSGVAAPWPGAAGGAPGDPDARSRRSPRSPQEQQPPQRTNRRGVDDDDDDDEDRGLRGFRTRRLERQRAARSR